MMESPRCAGELEPGEHALLHVWLVAKQRDDDGSVTLQGFGHLQPLDVLRADRNIGHVRASVIHPWKLHSSSCAWGSAAPTDLTF